MRICRICGGVIAADTPARALGLCSECEERILERAEDLLETREPVVSDPDWEAHLERQTPRSRWEDF
ncbi:MAG: hypothetical protein C0P61_010130 [Bacillota bacterium]|nr:hypothetical protein [Bacillota bacterium]REJ36739.1 MAG: hypothetical protein DIU82_03265 [Bacillota bacterium]